MMEYTGTINYIRFYSEDSKFIVASFDADQEEKPINITGYMTQVVKEARYRLCGDFIIHPRYGKQFQIQSYEMILADDREEIIRYLSSPLFKGIGKIQAEVIVDTLGKDCLNQIRENPNCLHIVRGMTEKKMETIVSVIKTQNFDQEVLAFFMGHGISTKYLARIQGVYKEKTLNVLQENPYQLIEDIDGIGFKSADTLAMKLHFDPHAHVRVLAAIKDTMTQLCFKTGSTFTQYGLIQRAFHRLLPDISLQEFDESLNELLETHKIVLENDCYYPVDLYDSEKVIGDLFKKFSHLPKNEKIETKVREKINEIEESLAIEYDVIQKEAILSFMREPSLILTGGPGTGKTTIVQAILKVYQSLYPQEQIDLVAPTGRAAKRLSELTGIESQTIHRLLKWDLNTNTFAMNASHPLETSLLIVDEFSMVDSLLFAKVLEAGKYIKKILLIGDEGQLPSVAPGNVLNDMILSGQVPVIKLERVYRQEEGSGIVTLAHEVRNEQFTHNIFNEYEDIEFVESQNFEVISHIVNIVQEALENGYDMNDIQILSPMYNGVAGIDAINEAMQSLLNPPDSFKLEVKSGIRTFREGDKILQLKNRVEDNVFNGDIGVLVEIIPKDVEHPSDTLVVEFEGGFVEYGSNDYNQITHAYCMSVHKSQGNEFPIVIMTILSDYRIMMRKNLIYTGLTRAKKKLYLVGSSQVFEKGIHTNIDLNRQTSLIERLNTRELRLEDFN